MVARINPLPTVCSFMKYFDFW